MQTKPNLILFSDKLFPRPGCEHHFFDPGVLNLIEQAQQELKAQAGECFGVLSPRAEKNLAVALGGFVARLLLLEAHPEYLQKAARFWVDGQGEMLVRLQRDRTEIEERFCNGHFCGQLNDVALDLSDRHNQGRSVAVLTFDSGLKLVYKPRDAGIEDWYFRTLTWLNSLGAPLPFHTLGVLRRPGYGWVQFISHGQCRSQQELAQFYRNAGALLCVLSALGAEDCHFQNLVACGEYPVLVDAETLFQPRLGDSESNSVARTGMIPHWKFGPQAQAYDVSALGCVGPRSTHVRIPTWSATGVRFEHGVLTPQENVPFPLHDGFTPRSYVEQMVSGLVESYRFLADHRRQLIAQIRSAEHLRVRYVFRDTMEYYNAMNHGLQPAATPGIRLNALPKSRAVFDPLQQDEVCALEDLDIPRFTLPAGSRNLCGVENCFRTCGLALAVDRIERLCEPDLEQQVDLLRLAWSLSRVSNSLT